MGRILLVIIVLGAMLAWFGYQEWRLAGAASPTPAKITCAQLESSGPGENAHVILTDFILCPTGFVYQGTQGNDSHWTTIWIPAVPIDGDYVQQIMKQAKPESPVSHLPPPQ